MSGNYVPLEQNTEQQLSGGLPGGAPLGFTASAQTSLFATTSFLYTASIMLIVAVAAGRYMLAGVWRIQASESAVTRSNKEIRRVTFGLLGVLSLFVILYTFNKGLLRGDVGLDGLSVSPQTGGSGLSGVVPVSNSTSLSGSPKACESLDGVKSKLSSGNICGGAICSRLSGCKYQQFLPTIKSEALQQGVDPRLVVAIMCEENQTGDPTAHRQNTDISGRVTYDCGLMQVNQLSPCTQDSYDIASNIRAGVKLIKAATGQVYQSIPQTASIAAAYNTGPGYNQSSADCTVSSGFPFSIPKWACPINPGVTTFNMCSVKSYACDVSACVDQLSTASL